MRMGFLVPFTGDNNCLVVLAASASRVSGFCAAAFGGGAFFFPPPPSNFFAPPNRNPKAIIDPFLRCAYIREFLTCTALSLSSVSCLF